MQTHYTTNSQHGPVKLRSNAVVHTAGAPIETCVIGTTEPAVRLRLQQRSVYPNRDGRPALFPTRLEIRKLPPSEISRAMTGNQSTAVVAETVPQWQLRPIISQSRFRGRGLRRSRCQRFGTCRSRLTGKLNASHRHWVFAYIRIAKPLSRIGQPRGQSSPADADLSHVLLVGQRGRPVPVRPAAKPGCRHR